MTRTGARAPPCALLLLMLAATLSPSQASDCSSKPSSKAKKAIETAEVAAYGHRVAEMKQPELDQLVGRLKPGRKLQQTRATYNLLNVPIMFHVRDGGQPRCRGSGNHGWVKPAPVPSRVHYAVPPLACRRCCWRRTWWSGASK